MEDPTRDNDHSSSRLLLLFLRDKGRFSSSSSVCELQMPVFIATVKRLKSSYKIKVNAKWQRGTACQGYYTSKGMACPQVQHTPRGAMHFIKGSRNSSWQSD